MRLRDVVAAVERRDHAGALVALLDAWRETPNERIAALVDRVSDLATRGMEPIAGKNQAARAQAAVTLIEDPVQLPRVMRLLHELQRKAAKQLLEEVAERCDRDPRILGAALALFANPPFVGSGSTSFWRALIDLVGSQGDPRARDAIRALDFTGLTAWQRNNFEEVCARIDQPKKHWPAPSPDGLSAEQAAACTAIEAALGTQTADGDTLLANIYEHPADDGARTVYADWLEEQGDPRGPFITAQLASATRAATETERRVIASALEAHEERWLGGLANAVRRARFERGFPVSVAITSDSIAAVAAAREAATLEEVWLIDDEAADLEPLRGLGALRLVGGLRVNAIRRLLDADRPWWPATGLDLYDLIPRREDGWTAEAQSLRDTLVGSSRALRELAVEGYARDPASFGFLWGTPLVEGIERLRLATGIASVPYWLAHTQLPRVRELEISQDFGFRGWTCRFTRGEDGELSKLVAIVRPADRAPSLAELGSLVLDELATDLLTEVELRADGVRVQSAMLDAIAAAATRHPRLARLALPGRDPIDPRGRPAARTAKAVAAASREQVLAAFHDRVCTAAADLVSPKALAALEPTSWDTDATLRAVAKWLPKKPADARWGELAVVLLSIPGPTATGFHELARALYPLLAALEPERLWTRLQPIGEVAARVLFAMCDSDRDLAGALFDRDELPALLDWFELLTVQRASAVYYGVRTLLIATGDEHIRAAVRTRLTTHKLHRFHRWTYEEAVKSIRARPVRRGKSR